MNDDSLLDPCGCGEGPRLLASTPPENPPGLPALAYRIGTHGRFNADFHVGLATDPALRALTTRDSSDPSLALLDAWAVVLDVLTFYQERIANEGFLRTATERRSILELARAIGYELRPGVAAGTCLAFTVDDVVGSPATVKFGIGTKAQSVPGQNEKPQIFETVEEIEARPEWNALQPQRFVSSLPLQLGHKKIYLQGTATGLKIGDALLFIGDERKADPINENWDFRRVAALETVSLPPTKGASAGYTVITLDRGLGTFMPPTKPTQRNPKVYALRQRAAVFGYNAVDWKALPDLTRAAYLGIDLTELTDELRAEWPGYTIFSPNPAASAARSIQRVVHSPATAQQVAAAVTTTAHAKSTNAASAAAQAGMSLVATGAALGKSAADLADKTSRALDDVAKQSANAVQNTVVQGLEAQMRNVASMFNPANFNAPVDAVLQRAITEIKGLNDQLLTSITATNPLAIVRSVLDAVLGELDRERSNLIDGIASAALGAARGIVAGLDAGSILGDLLGVFGDLIGQGDLVSGTISKAASAIDGAAGDIAANIPGHSPPTPGDLTAEAQDVLKPFKDAIASITGSGISVDALVALAMTPVRAADTAAQAAGNVIKSAASFAYGSLAQTHASITAVADEVSRAAIAASRVVNPDNVLSEIRDAANDLRTHAEDAALASQKSVGAAISASIVIAAVKIALDAPDPLPPPTPESIAKVAKLFGDASVALLQADEGVTPALVREAIDSPVGKLLGDTFTVASQAIAGARTFVTLSDAIVNGARETVAEIKRAIDVALLGSNALKRVPAGRDTLASTLDLDAVYPKIVASKGWLVLSMPEYQEVFRINDAAESARAEFSLSGKTTRITLGPGENQQRFADAVRTTVVYAESEALAFADQPRVDSVAGGEIMLTLVAAGLKTGQLLSVTGIVVATGKTASEVVEVKTVTVEGNGVCVALASSLTASYVRDSVTINANVARATHGETKADEVLGSGDGSLPFQRFTLKQKPLTFVSAPVAGGAKSTLEVRVKGVLWHETPSFYETGPNDRSFVVRRADDGTSTLQFGDGITGARLPTGTNNLTATYRTGLGLAGLVDAATITTLLSRPLGAKAVSNPIPATGAGDPEILDDARTNAPLTVLTLDRIVSVQDFEDFARAFAGIGKAQATVLWNGERQLVHLTVAAGDGSAVDPTSDFFYNLTTGIDAARHADQPVRVSPHVPLTFTLSARVAIDPDFIKADVLAAVKTALVDTFSFASRGFGQGVTSSEVLAVIQKTPGVVAVDLDRLNGLDPIAHPNVPANIAHWNLSAISGAELLLVDADGITLTDLPL